MSKKKEKHKIFVDLIRTYLKTLITESQLDDLNISIDELSFTLGSLIYPKEMLKLYTDQPELKT